MPNPSHGLSVVPDEVIELGQHMSDLVQALRSALDIATREVDGLAGSWTGTAADAFGEGWSTVHEGGTQLLNSLAALASSLGVAAGSYQQQDGASAANLGSTSLDL
ncbi:WXG100 family type VII secretion target [Nocardia sp. NBC_00565]|uniref:WXG100 family type VII secretion target n=1 Tax=Nocardia sp. NBC_00565 TaxID=2975993 RepID=UPI002E8238D7|nr:WXG100 family type VII secretion target [Nocardia sp. NBC_00565]WUC07924.1 WXG100 family type VII secretion target [Nocardia sp. NBC_00565]